MLYKKSIDKKFIAFIIVLIACLLLSAFFIYVDFSDNQKSVDIEDSSMENILCVGGENPDFFTIGDAIAASKDGDVIFVHSNLSPYYENIVVNKAIRLVGENKTTTIIDGNGEGDVVKIVADEVYFANFTVQNGGTGSDCLKDAAIEILSNDNVIINNICSSANYGIWLLNSTGNMILNNTCFAEFDGIWLLNSGNNFLRNNSMSYCGLVSDGLDISDFIQDIDSSNTANEKPIYYYNNQEEINVPYDAGQVIFVNCRNCVASHLDISSVTDGIQILHSQYNVINDNKISGATDSGIRLFKSDYNTLTGNICSGNPVGILFKSGGDWIQIVDADCKYNTITGNSLQNSQYCGILVDSSNQNDFSKNNFMDNGKSVLLLNSGKNRWHRNYWGDGFRGKHKLIAFLPKPIHGVKYLQFGKERTILWLDFDFMPAKRPYDI